MVILAAVAVGLFGVGRLVAVLRAPPRAVVGAEATHDGVNVRVTAASWTGMDHDMSGTAPGYTMPPAMMPGMPAAGEQRLAVTVTVVNTSDETRPVRPAREFTLRAATGEKGWEPHSHTFGELPRLAAHNALAGTLFFDLPPADLNGSPAWIEWNHEGVVSRLSVPFNGAVHSPHR
ncbi:hypothetical protein [Amycolatopsis anabasis]|uniref:hypothetical protein n=1 Tax=Amycolatopsis anabasis TaxID=1840409 RepID=UPI00131E757D|nr:hypothetical protein [Amycolatopsis anabasis]